MARADSLARILALANTSGGSSSGGGTSNYLDLVNKPSINGITLEGDIKASDLGLGDLSGVPVLTGTKDKPIIMSDLVDGNKYVISGYIKSNNLSTTTVLIDKGIWECEDSQYWKFLKYMNPYGYFKTIQGRIDTKDTPIVQSMQFETTEGVIKLVKDMTIDGGQY